MNGENPTPDSSFDVPRTAMTSGDPDPPPTGQNGDDPNVMWESATLQALEIMASGPLDRGNETLPSLRALALTPAAWKIVGAAVKCALREGESVYAEETGEWYHGWWGLASDWKSTTPDKTDLNWVSACMMQKLNVYKMPVPILLEGDHPKIEADPYWQTIYDYPEAVTFGNVFLGPTVSRVYVCWDAGLASACGDPAAAMRSRICDTSPTCGLVTLGTCTIGAQGVFDGRYWTFPTYGFDEAIQVRLKTRDASCYGTD